jgi:hypothetical protein
MPGDIISYKYDVPRSDGSTGHFLFVYGYPVVVSSTQVSLVVFDSTSSKHGLDTRATCTATCGVGFGTMWFSHDSGTITAVRSTSATATPVSGVVAIAIARPLPNSHTSCYTSAFSSWENFPCTSCDAPTVAEKIMNSLNDVAAQVTPWSDTKTAYGPLGKSCTCNTGSGCTSSAACTATAVNCASACNVYILNPAGFVRYILRYGLGKQWYGTSSHPPANNWVIAVGAGTTTPNQLQFHNQFHNLSPSNSYYFKKISYLANLQPGDIISFNFTFSPNAHLMFALTGPTSVSGATNTYEVVVIDSAEEGHCQDTRASCSNNDCGIGIGKVYFVTNESGEVTQFFWSDWRWLPFPFHTISFTRAIPPE